MELDWTAIIVCLLGGGGLLANLINAIRERHSIKNSEIRRKFKQIDTKLQQDYDRMGKIERNIDSLDRAMQDGVEGIMLGLENDQVIFNAFRQNRINGESERQDQKMNEYFARCTKEKMLSK